ncbi:MAG: MBOAT family protein [bacterium]|nr:MBOAT family protein [bacterium]
MVFSSIIFLCGFLTTVLLLYYVLPKSMRNGWLFLTSLCFYAWGEPRYVLIMLFSTFFDYGNGRLIEYFRKKEKPAILPRLVLIVSIIGNLGILCFFKYTDFVIGTINHLTGSSLELLRLALPIGISFYTFQTMSYTIDVYRGEIKAQKNLISFGMYVCLFPQLIAGPIVRYRDIEHQVDTRVHTPERVAAGMQRFLIGLAKKVLLANQIGRLWDEVLGMTGNGLTTAMAWFGAIAFTFQIYFDFSGYSDMAIGLGQMLGFTFPENFDHPYEATSITQFWRKWHITLGSWFREYVYIPLGGNRKGLARQICNLFVVWFLTGLWHGAGWNFVLWGLYYFVLLLLEKTILLRVFERIPRLIRHVYSMLMVMIGWVIFACDDLGVLGQYLKALFGIGAPLTDARTVFVWSSNALFLLILAVGATTLPARLCRKIIPEKARSMALAGYTIALLAVSLALLVAGSYNPFLYFRF